MNRKLKEIYESPTCLETVIILEQVIAASGTAIVDGTITVNDYLEGGEFNNNDGATTPEFEIKW